MAYKKLTEKGKGFIRNKTSHAGNNLLTGRFNYALPYSPIKNNKTVVFTAKPTLDGKFIVDNKGVGEAVIIWADRYGSLYELDANIVAAQMAAEGAGVIAGDTLRSYITWAYSPSGAIGISQFLGDSIWTIIYQINPTLKVEKRVTTDEINKLFTGISGDIKNNPKILNDSTNRIQLHQNIMNNPEIMVKLQCLLLAYIQKNNQNLASSTLFCYNRGANIKSTSYLDAIKKCELPVAEGLGYVNKIYGFLVDGFGYDKKILTNLIAEENGLVATKDFDFDIISKLNKQQADVINRLHYQVKHQFANLIYQIEKKTFYKVYMTSGYRTFAEQMILYLSDDRNAIAGTSYHNYGLAVDFVLQKDGVFVLDKASSKEGWINSGVVAIASELGFSWGGDFTGYFDPVHFDLRDVYPINDLLATANLVSNNDLESVIGNKIPLA